jgi:hypothetical protein
MNTGRNAPCPCGSGEKYKKCCLPKADSPKKKIEGDTSADQPQAALFKPVQFLGRAAITPSKIHGKIGALVQFIIPGLTIGKNNITRFQRLALNCSDIIEKTKFDRVTRDQDKQPATLVTIAFHYMPDSQGEPHKDTAERLGRLIAERFVSLLSFAVGERLSAIHQQVSKVNEDGTLSTHLHPQSKVPGQPRQIEVADILLEKKPSEDIFKALFWLRRGISERDHLNAYAALMVALEILSGILVPPETTIRLCSNCGAEVSKLTRSSVKSLVVETLGESDELFQRLWKVRNAIVAHGGQAVTANVLADVVELKLEAIPLVFRGLKIAMGIPQDGPPNPSPMVMITDTFLVAE